MDNCWFCQKVLEMRNGKGKCSWNENIFKNSILGQDLYVGVDLVLNKTENILYMVGIGEDETEPLFINYCPCCGKEINK